MTNKFDITNTHICREEMVKASEFFTSTDTLLNKLRRKMSALQPQHNYNTRYMSEVHFN